MKSANAITKAERILGGLWGALCGDALGVPVEFRGRTSVQADPVTGMRGYGTHGQPAGTWSDDSSLLLCTAESLVAEEFSVEDLGERFVRWQREGYWTPHGTVFDIGIATSEALRRVAGGTPAVEAGGTGEYDNGNGSLMRVLPVCLRFAGAGTERLVQSVGDASRVTHGHRRSVMACVFYAFLVRALLDGAGREEAVDAARRDFGIEYGELCGGEGEAFGRLLGGGFAGLVEGEIRSSGYVIDTLEAAVWCLLKGEGFAETVLRAVNLGEDADTTGCVTGGLAGVFYGLGAVPGEWRQVLARAGEAGVVFARLAAECSGEPAGAEFIPE